MKAKLMSYNQIDFQSKAHMKSMIKDIEEQVEKYGSQMKKAGLVSFVLTQIWNKQGKFRLGSHFSYRDEKAFVACQKILNGIPQDEDNPTVTNADRGIVLLTFGDEQQKRQKKGYSCNNNYCHQIKLYSRYKVYFY